MVFSKDDPGYRQCAISVMDNIADPDIRFDEKGICNYYYEYLREEEKAVLKDEEGRKKIAAIVNKIKEAGKGKPYDCITGISGGVDSTYLCLKAKEWGLRPLVVHFDNGWNSELAVKNIENIIGKLGFDLHTLVVDWGEFKDIQLAYLKASVVDIEVVTDHAIITTLYKLALAKNIKYVLSGSNIVTEATLPRSWIFNKTDHVNLKAIHNTYGTIPMKTYPLFDFQLKRRVRLNKIESINPLNYIPYIKKEVKNIIAKELNWRDYGGKHYESIFTRFYQGYILPVKFHIDKRKAHLSNLIFSGQLTKAEALNELAEPIYAPQQLLEDKEFVLKKLKLSSEQFEEIINLPRREHIEFAIERGFYDRFPIVRPLKPLGDLLKKLI